MRIHSLGSGTRRSQTRWLIAALAACVIPLANATEPVNGVDIARRIADGKFILIGTPINDGTKVQVSVERMLRGEELPQIVRLNARAKNSLRGNGLSYLKLKKGDRSVFVLERMTDRRGEIRKEDIFQPTDGPDSQIDIPAEGEQALIEAIEQIIYYQDSDQRFDAEARLLDWLVGPNPWLVDFALDQARRFPVADRQWMPSLVTLTRDIDPDRREMALEALAEIIATGRARPQRRVRSLDGADLDAEDDGVKTSHEAMLRSARTDSSESVRRAAIRSLVRVDYPQWRAVLESIAEEDASHTVRYEAATALLNSRNP